MVNAKKLSMVIAGAAITAFSWDLDPAQAHKIPHMESYEPGSQDFLRVTPETPRPAYYEAGNVFKFLALGPETDNQYSLFELTAPAEGGGVPAHYHNFETEVFYLKDGQLRLYLNGGETLDINAGSFAYLPEKIVHAFENTGTTTATMLGFSYPGGYTDAFVQATGTLVTDPTAPIPAAGDLSPIFEAALDYGVSFYEPFPSYTGDEEQIVVSPGAPDRPVYDSLGGKYTSLITSEESGGQFSIFDVFLAPQAGSGPLQIDNQETETFYVMDGEVQFQVGDQTTVGTPGTYFYLPTGTPYAFQNLETTPARMLSVSSPTAVPEPSSLLGLLGFGAYLGVSLVLKRKQKKQKLVNLDTNPGTMLLTNK